MKKIRIAFIKFAGLSAGGTEKFLQTIAANLDPTFFSVDYFYCDSAPYVNSDYKHIDTDIHRKKYMEKHGINLIKFDVGAKDVTKKDHRWINTNFWQKFKEEDYDIVQTGRAGFPEYPFTKIRKVPIVDSLHIIAGVDNQYNISRVMHITDWSAKRWIHMHGDKNRVVRVSHPMEIVAEKGDMKERLHFKELFKEGQRPFVFGFHQRADDGIFSSLPLEAYKKIETDNTLFLLMGGSRRYTEKAKELEIKRFIQIPHSARSQDIYDFLQTVDVYAHGRKDGEINSTAMAEAMYFGLPIVSHYSEINNGHVECIADAGLVVHTVNEYADELVKLMTDKDYYQYRKERSKERFQKEYDLKTQMAIIEGIYRDVVAHPFPHPFQRRISSFNLYYNSISIIPRGYAYLKRKINKTSA